MHTPPCLDDGQVDDAAERGRLEERGADLALGRGVRRPRRPQRDAARVGHVEDGARRALFPREERRRRERRRERRVGEGKVLALVPRRQRAGVRAAVRDGQHERLQVVGRDDVVVAEADQDVAARAVPDRGGPVAARRDDPHLLPGDVARDPAGLAPHLLDDDGGRGHGRAGDGREVVVELGPDVDVVAAEERVRARLLLVLLLVVVALLDELEEVVFYNQLAPELVVVVVAEHEQVDEPRVVVERREDAEGVRHARGRRPFGVDDHRNFRPGNAPGGLVVVADHRLRRRERVARAVPAGFDAVDAVAELVAVRRAAPPGERALAVRDGDEGVAELEVAGAAVA
mmetsp:Transcript_9785/g.33653  ORF Transcript_9785/g.33653 Transcript_9785/m.33653 type:complete len:344 (-) Transcript_9785:269-1300(-)